MAYYCHNCHIARDKFSGLRRIKREKILNKYWTVPVLVSVTSDHGINTYGLSPSFVYERYGYHGINGSVYFSSYSLFCNPASRKQCGSLMLVTIAKNPSFCIENSPFLPCYQNLTSLLLLSWISTPCCLEKKKKRVIIKLYNCGWILKRHWAILSGRSWKIIFEFCILFSLMQSLHSCYTLFSTKLAEIMRLKFIHAQK